MIAFYTFLGICPASIALAAFFRHMLISRRKRRATKAAALEAAADRAAAALRNEDPEPVFVQLRCRTCGNPNARPYVHDGIREFFCNSCLKPDKDEPVPDFNDPQWYSNTNMKGNK